MCPIWSAVLVSPAAESVERLDETPLVVDSVTLSFLHRQAAASPEAIVALALGTPLPRLLVLRLP